MSNDGLQFTKPLEAQRPVKGWIVSVLLLCLFSGELAGRVMWPLFFRGKDPELEFFKANSIGILIFAVLAYGLQERIRRFHSADILISISLGLLSSVVGMAWGILNGYGR